MSGLKKLNVAEMEHTCIKVFDPNEPDPLKKLLHVYDNCKKAAGALGVQPAAVHKSCSQKSRLYSKTLKRQITCRLATS